MVRSCSQCGNVQDVLIHEKVLELNKFHNSYSFVVVRVSYMFIF